MIAQLSHSDPRGRSASSIIGVRRAGSFARKSGSRVLPQTSTSSKSRPAARTKMRTVRLLTLGLRMLSVFAATSALLRIGVLGGTVVREGAARALDEVLDHVGQVHPVDVVVAALDPEAMRLEQDVGVREPVRRLEAVRRELDQQAVRLREVDRVHEAAILDARVLDPALVEPLDGLPEGRLRDREREVVHEPGDLLVALRRSALRVAGPLLVREDGDQAPVAGVEVEVALGLVVEV